MNNATVAQLAPECVEETNIATSMYVDRFREDVRKNRKAIYARNPDARALYFKGAHDAITAILTWAELGDRNLAGLLTQRLHEQTVDTVTQ